MFGKADSKGTEVTVSKNLTNVSSQILTVPDDMYLVIDRIELNETGGVNQTITLTDEGTTYNGTAFTRTLMSYRLAANTSLELKECGKKVLTTLKGVGTSTSTIVVHGRLIRGVSE